MALTIKTSAMWMALIIKTSAMWMALTIKTSAMWMALTIKTSAMWVALSRHQLCEWHYQDISYVNGTNYQDISYVNGTNYQDMSNLTTYLFNRLTQSAFMNSVIWEYPTFTNLVRQSLTTFTLLSLLIPWKMSVPKKSVTRHLPLPKLKPPNKIFMWY